jgi:hypothetical protein
MLTALRHPASAGQQRRLSGHGQPLTDDFESNKSKPPAEAGGLRVCARSRVPCILGSPNDPESPDFRPGLLAYAERQARSVPYRFTSRQAR